MACRSPITAKEAVPVLNAKMPQRQTEDANVGTVLLTARGEKLTALWGWSWE